MVIVHNWIAYEWQNERSELQVGILDINQIEGDRTGEWGELECGEGWWITELDVQGWIFHFSSLDCLPQSHGLQSL